MINLETMTSCVVDAKLDQPRRDHTADGDLVCGGYDGSNYLSSCYNVATQTNIHLINERSYHTSWSTGDGLYLLGGDPSYNYRTTELITGDTTQNGFTLNHWTRLIPKIICRGSVPSYIIYNNSICIHQN